MSTRKKPLSPLQQAYNKARQLLKRRVAYAEQRGYVFPESPIPEIPKRIRAGSVRRLERLTSSVLKRRTSKGQAEYRAKKRADKQREDKQRKKKKPVPKELKARDAFYTTRAKKKGRGKPPKQSDKVMDYINDVTQRWDGYKYEDYVRMMQQIGDFSPQRNWSQDYGEQKARIRGVLSNIIAGAIQSEGEETVMRRLEDSGEDIDDLVGYVLYGSDSAKVQSNLNKLTEIMYGRPLSMSEAISVSELQEGYTSFDDIDDEY
ncbi:MAG: hypothetical protein J6Q48_07415 [Bacteroidaceae bacterium]|nr:hypothetical protein [Bacteroidaceae bacterium]